MALIASPFLTDLVSSPLKNTFLPKPNGVFDKELKKSVSNNINYKSNEVFDSKEFNEIENLLLNKMKD